MKGETPKEALCGLYRVIELADETGVYCGKLLADLGADVIKVEPPGGDKTRSWPPFFHDEVGIEKSLYFLYYNTNKRSITLNLECEEGRRMLNRLVSTADVLVETFPPGYLQSQGLGYGILSQLNPGLVMTSITPFGQTGPYKDRRSSDLVAMAMSGYMQVTGEPDGSPLRFGMDFSNMAASQCAAAATMVALYHRNAVSGKGQHIDISVHEATTSYTQDTGAVPFWRLGKINVLRMGIKSRRGFPWGGFECKDGWVFIGLVTPPHWEILANWVYEKTGDKEILNDMYKGPGYVRTDYIDILDRLVTEMTKKFTKDELYHEGQRRGIVTLPVATVEDLAHCPQLNARDYFAEVEHPVLGKLMCPTSPFLVEGARMPMRKAAPLLGEANEDVYSGELGFSKQELATMKAAHII